MKMLNKVNILFFVILLSSCAVGDDYKKPEIKFKKDWNSKYEIKCSDKVTDVEVKKVNFLNSFNDTVLKELLTKAKANNFDLKIAESRILQARSSRKSALSNFFPSVPFSASAKRSDTGFATNGSEVDFYESSFDATWEIDFFGGLRRRLEASKANLRANQFKRDDVIITLLSEVAINYVELRNLQKQVEVSKKNIANQKQLVDLTKLQMNNGLISGLEVEQAKALLETTSAKLPQIETALEATKNRLNVLLGEQPGTIDGVLNTAGKVPVASAKVVINTPASVIQGRPDVLAQEQLLIAQNAMVGVAFAELFPKISLTGSYGSQNTNTTTATDVYSYGAGLIFPILNFSKIRANIDIADAKKQEEYFNYEKVILTALEDVDNRLTAYLNEEKRKLSLRAAYNANIKSVAMAKNLYNEGITSFLNVLTAQQKLYESEIMLADSKASVAKNLIALNKSIGGRD